MANPPDSRGYNTLVYRIVAQIPHGRVATYGQIASMIPPRDDTPGKPPRPNARLVGWAMHLCPAEVAWWRVINRQGTISLPPGSLAAAEQRARLDAEGVTFDEDGRVDFQVFGWDGPDDAWLRKNGLFAPYSLKTRKR
jgi:methylated-DNA-protein-cysteine methyltransferase-like protein